MGMLQEFKEFAMKGNLIDMAVGVVMGAAFGTVTKSFIDGMFMPIIGTIFQVGNLKDAKVILKQAVMEGEKVVSPESAILYGDFVSAIINFIIIAFVMFMIIKGINKMKKAKEEAPAAPPAQEVLLTEIRDLLKK
ncbi:MAG: large-conductance mechanosensitive channel protein MscL [Bacteroidia bacterium]|nr:large-conductance mechanosensitive channel protein MscL [Bacteroidia bacterium]